MTATATETCTLVIVAQLHTATASLSGRSSAPVLLPTIPVGVSTKKPQCLSRLLPDLVARCHRGNGQPETATVAGGWGYIRVCCPGLLHGKFHASARRVAGGVDAFHAVRVPNRFRNLEAGNGYELPDLHGNRCRQPDGVTGCP